MPETQFLTRDLTEVAIRNIAVVKSSISKPWVSVAQADFEHDFVSDLNAEIEAALDTSAEAAAVDGDAALESSVEPKPSQHPSSPPAVDSIDAPAAARRRTTADVVSCAGRFVSFM